MRRKKKAFFTQNPPTKWCCDRPISTVPLLFCSLKALGSNYTLNLFHISHPTAFFVPLWLTRCTALCARLFRSPQIEIDLSRYGITAFPKAKLPLKSLSNKIKIYFSPFWLKSLQKSVLAVLQKVDSDFGLESGVSRPQ